MSNSFCFALNLASVLLWYCWWDIWSVGRNLLQLSQNFAVRRSSQTHHNCRQLGQWNEHFIVAWLVWLWCRSCLNLISSPHPAITEELDLIEALRLLSGFGVNILPVQGDRTFASICICNDVIMKTPIVIVVVVLIIILVIVIIIITTGIIKQGVALTGRNRTGPPCSVGRLTVDAAGMPTAHAPGSQPAPRRQHYRPRQTTPTDNRCQPAKQYWPMRRSSNNSQS